MLRLCRLYFLALLLSATAFGQSKAGPFSLTATTSPCATITVTANATVGIQVTGTFSATLTPYVSIQGQAKTATQVTPANSSTAQATITTTGVYTASGAGYDTFLLCATSYASGTATVWLNATTAIATNLLGGGGGGTYTFFGNTMNPLTALVDPTTIIDAQANFLQYTVHGVTLEDYASDFLALNGDDTSGILEDANGDLVEVENGTGVTLADSTGDSCSVANTAFTCDVPTRFPALESNGTTFTASGCSNGTLLGGSTAGSYHSGTSGTCTVTVTMGGSVTAAHGWACSVWDTTTTADVQKQTTYSTSSATFSGTTVSGDVIIFSCIGF